MQCSIHGKNRTLQFLEPVPGQSGQYRCISTNECKTGYNSNSGGGGGQMSQVSPGGNYPLNNMNYPPPQHQPSPQLIGVPVQEIQHGKTLCCDHGKLRGLAHMDEIIRDGQTRYKCKLDDECKVNGQGGPRRTTDNPSRFSSHQNRLGPHIPPFQSNNGQNQYQQQQQNPYDPYQAFSQNIWQHDFNTPANFTPLPNYPSYYGGYPDQYGPIPGGMNSQPQSQPQSQSYNVKKIITHPRESCSTHGKLRSTTNLVEINGKWECTPEDPCKLSRSTQEQATI
jgi:hypothetical protein